MKYKKKTLDNGLRVIVAPMKEAQTATVLVYAETGSDFESKDKNGISHFLEHMLFKGTKKRTCQELNIELDAAGASSNAFTSNEYTGYYGKAHYKKLPKILDVISDIYINSTFPEADIEKERGVIIEEINMYEDKPNKKAWQILNSLMYGDQPAGRDIGGTISTVKKFNRKDFLEYKDKYYTSKNTIVVVAGNVKEKEAFSMVEERFGEIKNGKKETKTKTKEKQDKPKIVVKYKKTDQSHLVFGFRSLPINHKEVPIVSMISAILGGGMSSRLFREMRDERGLCYYIYSHQDLYTDRGLFAIGSGVNNKKLEESLKVILEECKRMTEEEVSLKELKKAKDYTIGNLAMDLEGSDDIAIFLGSQEILTKKIRKPKEFFEEIRAVTPKDILRVSKKIFNQQGANLSIVGPLKNGKALEKHWQILPRRKK